MPNATTTDAQRQAKQARNARYRATPHGRAATTAARVDYARTCPSCGHRGIRHDATYCSRDCARSAQLDRRSPIRRAVEDGSTDDVVEAIRQHVTVDGEHLCWMWNRSTKEGYAVVRIGLRTHLVHRLVMGNPPDAVVHHVCARPGCVNPDHLQRVTHRENTAEMLERNHYLGRIAALQAALAELDPSHPLLG